MPHSMNDAGRRLRASTYSFGVLATGCDSQKSYTSHTKYAFSIPFFLYFCLCLCVYMWLACSQAHQYTLNEGGIEKDSLKPKSNNHWIHTKRLKSELWNEELWTKFAMCLLAACAFLFRPSFYPLPPSRSFFIFIFNFPFDAIPCGCMDLTSTLSSAIHRMNSIQKKKYIERRAKFNFQWKRKNIKINKRRKRKKKRKMKNPVENDRIIYLPTFIPYII